MAVFEVRRIDRIIVIVSSLESFGALNYNGEKFVAPFVENTYADLSTYRCLF